MTGANRQIDRKRISKIRFLLSRVDISSHILNDRILERARARGIDLDRAGVVIDDILMSGPSRYLALSDDPFVGRWNENGPENFNGRPNRACAAREARKKAEGGAYAAGQPR